MALPDLEIVKVVRRGDLHRAGALFGVGIFVGDDGNEPPDQRQADIAPDEFGIALVFGMHGDRRVSEHRLGPRCRDGDELAAVLPVESRDRVTEVPQMALHFRLQNFEIGDRGVQHGIPIDETLGLIDQPLAMELDEHLDHRARKPFVEREPLARPVAGGAEPF